MNYCAKRTSVGLALKSSCPSLFVVCNRFGLDSAWATVGGHAHAYWYFDAKIMFLLFLTKYGLVSNRLSHKDFRIGGSQKIRILVKN